MSGVRGVGEALRIADDVQRAVRRKTFDHCSEITSIAMVVVLRDCVTNRFTNNEFAAVHGRHDTPKPTLVDTAMSVMRRPGSLHAAVLVQIRVCRCLALALDVVDRCRSGQSKSRRASWLVSPLVSLMREP